MTILQDKKYTVLHLQAENLRKEILASVRQNGGHLAGNLGTVELTLALHKHFHFPTDKLIFDVGHQSYAHKILTGRKLDKLRQMDGVSGFNDPNESAYDAFIAGHSGNSISAAIGLCHARDLKKEDFTVVVVIGDASVTNGLALEALFSSSQKPKKLIVILNDNNMSISENKSALQNMTEIEKKTFFTSLGFAYIEGGDGHNFADIFKAFALAEVEEKAVFIRFQTIKGKGLEVAESHPCDYHSLQKEFKSAENDFSKAMAEAMEEIAEREKNTVFITPAMQYGLALDRLFERYPERTYDVGICESHAFTMAAGMAKGGVRPIVATYSTFLQRAYDQWIHDICLQNLPVVLCLDRAGFVGGDGKTHQGIFDIAALRQIPNLQIYSPKDCQEGKIMLQYAIQQNCPVAIRYPNAKVVDFQRESAIDKEHLWEVLVAGENEIVLLASGARAVARAVAVAEQVKDITVINARTIKPLDEKILKKIADKNIYTIEEGYIAGGFGSAVAEWYIKEKMSVNLQMIAIDDIFIDHGQIEEQVKTAKITVDDILHRIEKVGNK